MIPNSYIHQQLAAARRRDLLEAAGRFRVAAQAHHHGGAGSRVGLLFRLRVPRRRTAVQPCRCATTSPTATR